MCDCSERNHENGGDFIFLPRVFLQEKNLAKRAMKIQRE
jgi:hypothetical protein